MRAWAWQMTCVYAHLQDPVHFSQRDHEIVGASDCRRRVTDSGDAHAPALLLRLGDNLEERMSRMCGRGGEETPNSIPPSRLRFASVRNRDAACTSRFSPS